MEHFKDPGIREQCQKQLAPFYESFVLLADPSTLKRPEKKKAIDSFKIVINDDALNECAPIYAAIILDELSGFLNEWQASKIEYVREKGLSYATLLVQRALLPDSVIAKLLSLALSRLKHQHTGMVLTCTEPTEEIRMKWLVLLLVILEKLHQSDDMGAVNVEKTLDIIQLAMEDPFSEVQKKGGETLLQLATKCPKGIALAGQRPMKLVLPLLYHKHSAIRATGLLTAGQIALAVPESIPILLDYDQKANRQAAFPSLVQDPAFNVRNTFPEVISMWLMRMAPVYRHKFAPTLIPLLLSSAIDEVASIADSSNAKLSEIGALYCTDLVSAGVLDAEPPTPEECAQLGTGLGPDTLKHNDLTLLLLNDRPTISRT
ncbi:hypothetical protein BJV82DRAFT_142070 [Fennellomyces sp. T-0311]|nr:hypothetical protein BJV82DRAFT_142070 [Fennellomyces sp. T-0311]